MHIQPQTFSSADAPGRDATSGLLDVFAVKDGPLTLLSLYGFNSGAQQYLQLFDMNAALWGGIYVNITDTHANSDELNADFASALTVGEVLGAVQLTGVTGVVLAYARASDADRVKLYPTLQDAGADTNAINLTVDDEVGTMTPVPLHSMVIGASDNFSLIVPVSGIGFGRGLVAAVSTTAPYFTAGAKELTMMGTLKS